MLGGSCVDFLGGMLHPLPNAVPAPNPCSTEDHNIGGRDAVPDEDNLPKTLSPPGAVP